MRNGDVPQPLSLVGACLFLPLDLKVQLQATDYGSFLQNEASPLTVSVIDERLREKLVTEFHYMRNHCYPPLSTFLDYVT